MTRALTPTSLAFLIFFLFALHLQVDNNTLLQFPELKELDLSFTGIQTPQLRKLFEGVSNSSLGKLQTFCLGKWMNISLSSVFRQQGTFWPFGNEANYSRNPVCDLQVLVMMSWAGRMHILSKPLGHSWKSCQSLQQLIKVLWGNKWSHFKPVCCLSAFQMHLCLALQRDFQTIFIDTSHNWKTTSANCY